MSVSESPCSSSKKLLTDHCSPLTDNYANVNFVDLDGKVIETPWDILSLGAGIGVTIYDIGTGNWDEVGADLLGLAADTAAIFIPGVPGGLGAAKAAGRVGKFMNWANDAKRLGKA